MFIQPTNKGGQQMIQNGALVMLAVPLHFVRSEGVPHVPVGTTGKVIHAYNLGSGQPHFDVHFHDEKEEVNALIGNIPYRCLSPVHSE